MFHTWRRLGTEARLLAAAGVASFALLLWILCNPLAISTDCAAGLEWGQEIFRGAVTYVDVCELDPPLWGYLNVPAAAVISLLNSPPILTFSLLTWLCCAISKLAIWKVYSTSSSRDTIRTLGATIVLIASIFDLAMINMQGMLMFGQREHFLTLVLAPYIVLRYLRWNRDTNISPWLAVLVGIMAAVGVCEKPQYVLMPLAIELVWCIQKRSLRQAFAPEIFGTVAFGALYTAHFFLFENIREQYLKRWVPLLVQGYRYSSFPPVEMFWITFFVKGYPELLVAATGFAIALRKRVPLILATVALAWAGYGSYMIQAKTWSYQAVPLVFGLFLTFSLAGLAVVAAINRGGRSFANAIIATICGVAIFLFGFLYCEYLVWEARFVPPPDDTLANLIRSKTAPNDQVLILSTTPGDAYPLLMQLGRKQGSRYDYEYAIDIFGYLRSTTSDQKFLAFIDKQEKQFVTELATDIATRHPKLILIRYVPQPRRHTKYSVLEYVQSKPELVAALSKYKPTQKFGFLQAFELSE